MAASADQVLNILIQLGVIGEKDAQAANDLLKDTAKSAQDLNQSAPAGSETWAKYKNILGETGGEAVNTREKVELLRVGLEGAGAKFGMLGELARLFFNPATAGFAIATAGLEAYFDWQTRVEQKYADMVQAASKVNDAVGDIVRSGKSSAEQFIDISKAVASFRAELESASKQMQRDEEIASAMQDAARGQAENRKAAFDDQAKSANDLIALLQTMGVMDKTRADSLREQIAYRQKLKDMESDRAELAGQIGIAKNERDQIKRDYGTGDPVADYKAAATAQSGAQQQVTRDAKVITDMPAVIASLTQQIADADRIARQQTTEGGAMRYQDLMQQLTQQRSDMQAQMDAAKNRLEADNASLAVATENMQAVKDQKEKLDALNNTIAQLTNKLAVMDQRQTEQKQNDQVQMEASSLSTLFKNSGTQNIAAIFSQHAQELLAATGFSHEQIVNIMRQLLDHQLTLQTVLQNVQARVNSVVNQAKGLATSQ